MFSATQYRIRPATTADEQALADLAALDSARPIATPALIAERDGRPAAALSLADGRLVADPFQRTADMATVLRIRADALRAYYVQPSLRERIRAGLRARAVTA